jgi:hypothetical protein
MPPTERQLFPASWNVRVPPPPPRQASVGVLITRTVNTIRARIRDITRIVALTAGTALIIQLGANLLAPAPDDGTFSATSLLVSIIAGVLAGLLMVWLQASLTLLSGAERLGAPMPLKTALREGLEAVPAGVWTRFVQAVVMVVAFLCLVVPAIIFAVRFCLAMQISAFERRAGLDALRASNELVRERAWATFGRLFLFWLVQMAATTAFILAALIFIGIVGFVSKSLGVAAVLAVLAYLVAAGFAVAFYSIWRTEFYLAIVSERRALAEPEQA